jgi:hypothetical protein
MALNLLRGANTVEDSNPARVKGQEEVHTLSILTIEDSNTLSIELDTIPSPNQYSLEPRGSRTTVQLVLPVRSNHWPLRTALHHFLREKPFSKYLTRAFC